MLPSLLAPPQRRVLQIHRLQREELNEHLAHVRKAAQSLLYLLLLRPDQAVHHQGPLPRPQLPELHLLLPSRRALQQLFRYEVSVEVQSTHAANGCTWQKMEVEGLQERVRRSWNGLSDCFWEVFIVSCLQQLFLKTLKSCFARPCLVQRNRYSSRGLSRTNQRQLSPRPWDCVQTVAKVA